MKLILKEDVEKVGYKGEVVDVKDGFGRNYLIPKGLAVMATQGSIKAIEEEKKQRSRKIEADVKAAQDLASKLEETAITIQAKAGEDGKIFGTITNQQVADALLEKGFEVDRRKITVNGDVKTLGEYTATVRLMSEIEPEVKIWVVKAEEE